MKCSEFQEVLPDIIDGEPAGEHASHLKSCRTCAGLVDDLRAIASGAKLLCAADEPSPRVWTNLQRALEAEGLIRTSQPAGAVLVMPRRSWWSPAWLIPAAAVIVVAVALFLRNSANPTQQAAQETQTVLNSQVAAPSASSDEEAEPLLGHMPPAARARYEDSLKTVNAFIQDAQASLNENPNDDEAHHFLMEAYAQKTMVYELAMDRSLK